MITLQISNKVLVVLAVFAISTLSTLGFKQASAASTPPNTYISSMTVKDSKVSLYFRSNQKAIFQCKLDSYDWKSCSPGLTWNGLAGTYATPLTHTIQVRALNAARQVDSTPATITAKTPQTPVGQIYGLVVSEDGCSVGAAGLPGMTVSVEASSDSKGGSYDALVGASGIFSNSSGAGLNDMYVLATFRDGAGNEYARADNYVTAAPCPPAEL